MVNRSGYIPLLKNSSCQKTFYYGYLFGVENSPDSIFNNDAMVAIRTSEGRNDLIRKRISYFFTGDKVHTFISLRPRKSFQLGIS